MVDSDLAVVPGNTVNPDGTRNNTFALVLVPAGVTFWSGPAAAITPAAVALP